MIRAETIDKSVLAFGTVARERSPAYLAWIRQQKCVVPGCWGRPCEAHHLLHCPEHRARGLKASDRYVVPLCCGHHRGNDSPHGWGNEQDWAAHHGFDMIATAQFYWQYHQAMGARLTA